MAYRPDDITVGYLPDDLKIDYTEFSRKGVKMAGTTLKWSMQDIIDKSIRSFGHNKHKDFGIDKVYFNEPWTIVKWKDGSTTRVKCAEGDIYSKRMGLMYCIVKRHFSTTSQMNRFFEEYIQGEDNPHKYIGKKKRVKKAAE